MKLLIGNPHALAVLEQLIGWFPGRRAEIESVAEKAALGVQLDVSPMRRRHSKSQRGAYWSCLHEFGRDLGYSARETEDLLHPVICSETWGVKDHRAIRCLGADYQWPVPAETSSKDADGKVRDVETYNELIETLLRFAAEYGVYLEIKRP